MFVKSAWLSSFGSLASTVLMSLRIRMIRFSDSSIRKLCKLKSYSLKSLKNYPLMHQWSVRVWGNPSRCFSKPFVCSQLQHIIRYTMKIKWRKKKNPFLLCSLFVITYEVMAWVQVTHPQTARYGEQTCHACQPSLLIKSKSNMFQSGLIRAVSKCCYAEWSLTQHEHHHATRIMSLRPDGLWEELCCVAVISLLVLYLNACTTCPLSVIYRCKLRRYLFSVATRRLNPKNVNISVD